MLVKLIENLYLEAATDDVWGLLRDTSRLTALLPGVEDVTLLNLQGEIIEAYAARIREKLGPFKVTLNIEVHVVEIYAGTSLRATIKGADAAGLSRLSGSMEISLNADGARTRMRFEASVEILGKLVTLGAVPIRRRTTEAFGEFARNIQGQFVK